MHSQKSQGISSDEKATSNEKPNAVASDDLEDQLHIDKVMIADYFYEK